MLQQANIITNIHQLLNSKKSDNIHYEKSLVIFQTLLQSTKNINNFNALYGNNNAALALYLFGGVYKLLMRQKINQYGNITSLLILLNNLFPSVNVLALKQSGILSNLQSIVFKYCTSKEATPIIIRLSMSILSYTLLAYDDSSHEQQLHHILTTLFTAAIQSHRSTILTKQSCKLLAHLMAVRKSWWKMLAEFTKQHLIADEHSQTNLYLFNVKDILSTFPLRLINDISYRVAKGVHTNIETVDEAYRVQTYFFLEKMIKQGNVTTDTLEEIIQELIANIPLSTQSGQILHGYMQALSESIISLSNLNKHTSNRYLSPIIGIFQELMLRDGKVHLQATSLLGAIVTNCIDQTLWIVDNHHNLGLDLEGIELEQGSRYHNFGKVLCMMKLFLSSRFQGIKNGILILVKFFNVLNESAWDQTFELINEVITQKEQIGDKYFRMLFHAILSSMTVKRILKAYPICINYDIGDESFEIKSNIWILGCLEKYEGEDEITTFTNTMLPILTTLTSQLNSQPNSIRKQAYISLIDSFWRSFKIFCKKIDKNHNYEELFKLIETHLNTANDNQLIHILIGLEQLCINLKINYYQSQIAEKVISHLAKNCDLDKTYATHILKGIKALSLIARKSYLDRVFEKNITKLLNENYQGVITSEKHKNNMKNLQILMMISYGVNFHDPTVMSSYRLSKEQLVLKLVTLLLHQDNQYQKKAFKYMAELIPLMPHSFTKEVIDILESNKTKIRAASKIAQLLLLKRIWNQLNKSESENAIVDVLEFVKRYLPDILICNKENNKRARVEADIIFKQIYKRIYQMDLNEPFIQILCAGFATHGSDTKIVTLHALQLILNQQLQPNQHLLAEVLDLVLLLFKQNKTEIYRAILEYIRKYVSILDRQKQIQILPNIIQQIFSNDQQSRLDNRSILKHFLLKLIKKHGRAKIEQMIPQKDRRILINAIKVQKSLKKKQKLLKEKKKIQFKKKQKINNQQSQQDQNPEKQHYQQQDKMDIQQLENLDNKDNLLLKYDLEKQKFHFVQDTLKAKFTNNKNGNIDQEDIAFTKQGIMIINDGKKRQRQDNKNQIDQDENEVKAYQNIKKKRKVDPVHIIKESGQSFRSKRAGGDLQLKDKPQPYAFIQFNSKALNKRFKKKAEKVFDAIFQRKQGGIKGLKSRMLAN